MGSFAKNLFDTQVHILQLHYLSRRAARSSWKGTTHIVRAIKFTMRTVYGCEISPNASVDPSTRFPHPLGIVIGDGVHIGAGTMIWQHVTLGSHGRPESQPAYPRLGNNVRVYCGAVIIGDIFIGDGAIIGANTVVTKSVPSNAVMAGSPARIVSWAVADSVSDPLMIDRSVDSSV